MKRGALRKEGRLLGDSFPSSHGCLGISYSTVLVRVCWWVWMVVRFVCVIRVPVCARVSRVCVPAPPVSFYRYWYMYTVVARSCGCVGPGLDGCEVRLCLPCARVRPCARVSRLPPVSFGLFTCIQSYSTVPGKFVVAGLSSKHLSFSTARCLALGQAMPLLTVK